MDLNQFTLPEGITNPQLHAENIPAHLLRQARKWDSVIDLATQLAKNRAENNGREKAITFTVPTLNTAKDIYQNVSKGCKNVVPGVKVEVRTRRQGEGPHYTVGIQAVSA